MSTRIYVEKISRSLEVNGQGQKVVVLDIAPTIGAIKGLGSAARYQGAHPTPPTIREDGLELQVGDNYLNTTDGYLYYYEVGGIWDSPEKNAKESEVAAKASETAAKNSENAASLSEGNAAASEANAAASEASAATDAGLAENSKDVAATHATTATNKAAEATTRANEAASSAADAQISETNAGAHETNAASFATAAANSAAQAEAAFDNFDDRYLGAKNEDPTTDNDGNPLQVGASYWNIPNQEQRFWDGNAWDTPSEVATQAANRAVAARDDAEASELAAANSETNAAISEAAADADRIAAEAAAAAAAASESAAAASEGNAAASEAAAAASAAEAANKAAALGAMLKSEFYQFAEERTRRDAGSGYLEWGQNLSPSSYPNVNQGISQYVHSSKPDCIIMGIGSGQTGYSDSRTIYPIVNVAGIEYHVEGTGHPEQVIPLFPSAPDGTKSTKENTSEVHKFTPDAGVGVHMDAYTVNFDGNSWIKMPEYFLNTNSTIKFKFKWDGGRPGAYAYLTDTEAPRVYAAKNSTDELVFLNLGNVKVNGEPVVSSTLPLVVGVEYHLEADCLVDFSMEYIGCRYLETEGWTGEIWDIILDNPDNSQGPLHLKNAVYDVFGATITETEVQREGGLTTEDWAPNIVSNGMGIVLEDTWQPQGTNWAIECILSTDGTSAAQMSFGLEDNLSGSGDSWGFYAISGDSANQWYDKFIAQSLSNPQLRTTRGRPTWTAPFPTRAGQEHLHRIERVGNTLNRYIDGQLIYSDNHTDDYTPLIKTIGCRGGGLSNAWVKGSMREVRLVDTDNPANSRYYPVVVNNPTAPTTLKAVDEDYGTNAPFYSPDFDNTGSVTIPEWNSGSSSRIRFKVRLEEYRSDCGILSGLNADTRINIYQSGSTQNWFLSGIYNFTANGVLYGNLEFKPELGVEYQCEMDAAVDRTVTQIFALGYSLTYESMGRIWDIEFIDDADPTNSRYYPVIEYRPDGDTTGIDLVDKLGEKAYSPAWGGSGTVTNVQIPAWAPTGTNNEIQLKVKWVANGTNQLLLDSRIASNTDCLYVNSGGGISNRYGGTVTLTDIQGNVVASNIMESGNSYIITIANANDFQAPITQISTQYTTESLDPSSRIWDIRFTDNDDPTNSRFYPVIDTVGQGNGLVLPASEDSAILSDTFATDWTANYGAVINGNELSGTLTVASGAFGSLSTRSLALDIPVEVSFDLDALSVDSGFRVIVYMEGAGDQTVYEGKVSDVGSRVVVTTSTGGNFNNDNRIYFYAGVLGTQVTVSNIKVRQLVDGTLTNFPVGTEWTRANAGPDTWGTLVNFDQDAEWTLAGLTENLSAGRLVGFPEGTEWTNAKRSNGTIGGTTTLTPMSLHAAQKAFFEGNGFVPVISRKDLVFLETWVEDIAEKGVVFPTGNVQSNKTSWCGTSLTTGMVQQGYCAFGEWDVDTNGYGANWMSLTDAQRAKWLSEPKNNIFYDPDTNKYYQARYRIRVIEGLGDVWQNYVPSNTVSGAPSGGQIQNANSYMNIHVRGKEDTNIDWTSSSGRSYYNTSVVAGGYYPGAYHPHGNAAGEALSVPIMLVQRLNQGAYHPEHNPQGTATLWSLDNSDNSIQHWYAGPAKKPQSTSDCFTLGVHWYHNDAPQGLPMVRREGVVDNGSIARGEVGAGRDDSYKYYDAIYVGQVEDLRLNANKQDYARLLEQMTRSAVSGETRGKGKVPFTPKAMVWFAESGVHTYWRDCNVIIDGVSHSLDFAETGNWDALNTIFVHSSGVYRPRTWSNDYHTGVMKWNGTQWGDGNWADLYDPDGVGDTEGYAEVLVIPYSSRAIIDDVTNFFHTGDARGTFIESNLTGKLNEVFFLPQEYDSLPWVDIIGDPERIAATFPDGVIGQWIPQIPDGTSMQFNLNEKSNSAQLTITFTGDDGVSWNHNDNAGGYSQALNARTVAVTAGVVGLWQYEALSDFTEPDDNRAVVGKLGDVFEGMDNIVERGNRLMPSLIGEIATASNYKSRGSLSLNSWTIRTQDAVGEIHDHPDYAPKHEPIDLVAPNNNSDAVKALPHLVEKDGLLYVQWHATQLIYEASSFLPWGDDELINIVDGEGTKLDLNDNKVKVVTHTERIPIGIPHKNETR